MEEAVPGELAVEALLVAASGPLAVSEISERLPGVDLDAALSRLVAYWSRKGMNVRVKDGSVSLVQSPACARTLAEVEGAKARGLSRAAVETLSYLAINQPVSIADIEKGRGVKLFKGLMDSLLDSGFVRAAVRRTDSGRAVSYVTTDAFLEHFGLSALSDLPTTDELPDLVNPPSD